MNSFTALLLLASLLSAILSIFVYRRVNAPGARCLTVLILATGIWSACYAAELNSSHLQLIVFWAACAYFGILLVPLAWFVFTLAFTGQQAMLTRHNLLLLAVEPVIMLALIWSNPLHQLFYRQVAPVSTGFGVVAVYEHGPLFWVNAIYSYVLLLGGVFILIRSLLVSRNPIRGQVFVLLAAIAVPLVGNGLYITGYNPFPQFDLTPLAFLFSGLAVSWAFYRYRLLDVMPVVHAALVANLQDGLIVLDSRRRIVELNPAAEEVFAQPGAELIGRDVTDLDWGGSHILELLVKSEAKLEIAIGVGENKRYYDLRSSPLKDRLGNENGRLIVLRDITDQVKAGESLDRSEAILEVVSFAAASFLSTQSWEEAILEVLERFGKAAEVSRAYIFENRFDKQGVVLTSQRFEWAAEGIEPQIDNPELQNFSFQENGMGRWQQLLSSNQLVHGLTSSFPKQEQPLLLSEQIQSIVVAPIFAGQQWWGMIGLDECTYPRQWTRGEIDALEAAAGVIGSSIQRQKSEQAVRQRANELATLHEVSLVINSPHDLPDLLNAIVERAVTLLGGTAGGLYLCDADNRELQCVMCTNTSRDFSGAKLKYGEGAAGIVAQTGQPLIIDDYRIWEGRAKVYEDEQPFRSVLSAPLIWQAQVLGVIHILHDLETQRFDFEDLTLLTLFANQAAIALHNAQVYAETQQRAERVAMLNEITQESIRAADLDSMLQVLVERLAELFEADNTYITFWDEEHRAVIPAAAHGSLSEVYAAMRPIAGEVSMTSSVLNAGRVLVAEDVFYSPYISSRLAALFPARSMMGLPLIADGRKLGAALIGFNQPHRFTRQEIDLAHEVSSQIALAMTKIRLLELERRRANEFEALRATVADISSELDLPSLLKAILERATDMLNASGGDLGLYDASKNELLIVVSHNMGKDYSGHRMAHGEGAMGRAVELRQPVVIDNYQKWDGRSAQYSGIPYHAVLAVPLQVRGRIVGALGLVDRNPARIFSADDQRLLYLFSQQAATAIDNARLYADEKRRSTELGLLFESSTAMVKTLDLAEVYDIATERLAQAMDATSARIFEFNLESGQAMVLAEYASPQANTRERIPDVGTAFDLTDYPQTLDALRAGKPLVLMISSPDLDSGDRDEMLEYGIKSALNLPMMASDRVIGYAELWENRSERVWSEEEIQFCQTLANQAALVIENVRLYKKMQHLAITDTLTGVYNRRGLFEHGQREINRAIRTSRPLAAIMLDIDHFKQVNDAHSHAVGDQVLKALAKLCLDNLREVDIFGRYGGEEFAILLPETDIETAYQVAQRLRQCISETAIQSTKGVISITVSIGIACSEGEVNNLAVLLDRADTAMYEAKRAGRNKVSPAEVYQYKTSFPAMTESRKSSI